jgi:hypothetical protein
VGGLHYAAVSLAIKRQQQRAKSATKLIAESANPKMRPHFA